MPPRIVVLAGTNGAGKSSVGGAALRHQRGVYFNPDEAARRLREHNPLLTQREANIKAWRCGKRLLEEAIDKRQDYSFETTLGGRTMAKLLELALDAGFEVCVWYVGLHTVELHIARVAARVSRGGHDIPEADIRRRFDDSRKNLIRLLPRLAELRVFDNSTDGDPAAGLAPRPRLLLHSKKGKIIAPNATELIDTPDWAKPIVAAAMRPMMP